MPEQKDESRLERGKRDTEIRRETQVRNSLGKLTPETDEPKVTPEGSVLKEEPKGKDR